MKEDKHYEEVCGWNCYNRIYVLKESQQYEEIDKIINGSKRFE